jgi:outer membrane protein TolC
MSNQRLDHGILMIFGAALLMCILQAAAFAQQPDGAANTIPAFASGPQQMTISLSQAIQMALTNNKDVELARTSTIASDWDLKQVRASYEAHSTFSSFYENAAVPVNSFLSGGVNGSVTHSDFMAGYRIEGFAPKGGGSYDFAFSSRRYTTNNIFAALNPQYASDLTLNYTQPLGRGRSFPARLKDIEVAKKNSDLTDAQFRKTVTEIILNVKRAYWDLVFARNSLSAQTEVLKDARSQLDLSRRRARTGLAALSDVSRPEGRAAESEQNVYRALEAVTRAENVLKNQIAENFDSQLWGISLAPLETLDPDVPVPTLQKALDAALKDRPELQETDVVQAINDIEQRYFRDQARPQIDLVGSYGLAGLGGTFVNNSNALAGAFSPAPLPGFLEGGYGQSLTNLAQNRFNSVRAGVQISLPLHNHAAEARLGHAVVEGQRVRLEQEKLKQLIQMEVRNAYQAVSAAESRRRSASAFLVSMEQQYESEQRKSTVGYSTTDVVLDRHIALAAARINELSAQTERNKALAELERAMGAALESNGIIVRGRPGRQEGGDACPRSTASACSPLN